MRRIRVLVVALAAIVVAAGCGSSGGSKSSAPSGSSTTTSTTAASHDPVVTAGLLRPSDLPGWTHKPSSSASTAAEVKKLAAGIPTCANLVAKVNDGGHSAKSPDFRKAGSRVSDSIDVYDSAAAVAEQLDLYLDPTTIDCYRDLFRKTFTDEGLTVDSLDVSPIAVDHIGDAEFGYRLTTTITNAGQTQTVLSDQIGVQIGKYALSFEVFAPDTAGLAQLETTLLPEVVDRMKKAGA